MTGVPFITFAAVAQPVAAHGWRPFPGIADQQGAGHEGMVGPQSSEWDDADLVAAITEYQPSDDYCCCFAVQPEIVVIDADILDPGARCLRR